MSKREKAMMKIRAMLQGEGIDFHDVESALKSISETVLPTKLAQIYLEEIAKQ